MKILKIILTVFVVIVSCLYPFIAYWLLVHEHEGILPLVLIGIALIKLVCGNKKSILVNSILLFVTICIGILFWVQNKEQYMLLYPCIVNLIFLCFFGITLFEQKSFVESIASITTPVEKQTNFFKKYCRIVTIVWCVFFSINGIISLITVYLSREVWTVYNGFIAYIFIGLIFTVEYIVRIICQRRELLNDTKKL